MKYLLCFILLVFAFGVAAPPLIYTHALPAVPAVFSGLCLGFAMYLFDPTHFLEYCAELRRTVTSWFTKGA